YNQENSARPISFDMLLNARRFNAVIYKEENVHEDRKIDEYIFDNSLFQLLESKRIKQAIRDREQDMWAYSWPPPSIQFPIQYKTTPQSHCGVFCYSWNPRSSVVAAPFFQLARISRKCSRSSCGLPFKGNLLALPPGEN